MRLHVLQGTSVRAEVIGHTTEVAGIAGWRGVFTDRGGRVEIYVVPRSSATRLVPADGAPPREIPPGATAALAIGDVVEVGGDAIAIAHRVRALPSTLPVDDRERALLAAAATDPVAREVLADLWEERGDGARAEAHALVTAAGFDPPHLAPLVLDPAEPLAARDAVFRVSPRIYVTDGPRADTDGGRFVRARVVTAAGDTGERVALRVPLVDDPDVREHFERARRLLGRLPVRDHLERLVGRAVGREGLGIATAWAGTSLADIARRRGAPLGEPLALAIARAACRGLGAAHATGLVHRNLSLASLVVDARGALTIVGFAGARALDLPHWADGQRRLQMRLDRFHAPERIAGAAYDARADLFSLGAIVRELWEPDAALPPIVRRLLATNPDERPASASDALDLLGAGDDHRAELAALVE